MKLAWTKNILMVIGLGLFLTQQGFSRIKCADFSNQSEAQAYMMQNNARWLDGDKDGEACECLPGGSKYGRSVCRR